MRKIMNWLRPTNPENKHGQVAFAVEAKKSIIDATLTVAGERRRLGSLIHRELMVKEALAALHAHKRSDLLAKQTSYETALTRLRKQINEIRNRWARMQNEITALAQDARKHCADSRAGVAHEVQEEINSLLARLRRMRAAIARKMTVSARLYDGAALVA